MKSSKNDMMFQPKIKSLKKNMLRDLRP